LCFFTGVYIESDNKIYETKRQMAHNVMIKQLLNIWNAS
jgi:hypothetical protein